MFANSSNQSEPRPEPENVLPPTLLDLLLPANRSKLDALDELGEPSQEALEENEDLADIDAFDMPLAPPFPLMEAPVDLLAQLEEPELVSLEGLDEADTLADTLDEGEVEELLDDVDSLLEDYIDIDLDDDDLDDEGYDLDDDDIDNYRGLYGEDDTIIPSFREGEFAEDDDGDSAYYNEMR